MEESVKWINSATGPRLAARLYKPTAFGDGPHPVIVLATGLGTVKENRTISFVTKFTDAGYAAVTFDYAYWGESEGEPRHLVNPASQYRDVRNVVEWVREQADEGLDVERIVIWGTSFGGLHVTRLLAEDKSIVAGITQCPCVDAAIASRMKPIGTTLQLVFWAVLDALGSVVGRAPIYVSVAKMDANSGVALMEAPDVAEGYGIVVSTSHGPLKNKLAARSVISFRQARPALQAAKITAPFLLVVPSYDSVAPLEAAKRVAETVKSAELVEVPGGHFDVYDGRIGWDDNIRSQLSFLQRHVPLVKSSL